MLQKLQREVTVRTAKYGGLLQWTKHQTEAGNKANNVRLCLEGSISYFSLATSLSEQGAKL